MAIVVGSVTKCITPEAKLDTDPDTLIKLRHGAETTMEHSPSYVSLLTGALGSFLFENCGFTSLDSCHSLHSLLKTSIKETIYCPGLKYLCLAPFTISTHLPSQKRQEYKKKYQLACACLETPSLIYLILISIFKTAELPPCPAPEGS